LNEILVLAVTAGEAVLALLLVVGAEGFVEVEAAMTGSQYVVLGFEDTGCVVDTKLGVVLRSGVLVTAGGVGLGVALPSSYKQKKRLL
jgi:hypothetical protein